MNNARAMLDSSDRAICAALLRDGRASWRRVAEVTGIPERTVARRAARLFDEGLLHVSAFPHPQLLGRGDEHLVRLRCAPRDLREVARWLAHRPESLWVASTAATGTVIAECFFPPDTQAEFLEEELAALPVTGFSSVPVARYFRTVRGWQPPVLTPEQYGQLGEDEARTLVAENLADAELDQVNRDIIAQLTRDGRISVNTIAPALGLSQPPVRRRIQQMRSEGVVSIRGIVEPAIIGFPYEALLTVSAPVGALDAVGEFIASDGRTRWAAETSATGEVHALVALATARDLHALMVSVDRRFPEAAARLSTEPVLTMYKRSDLILPAAYPPAD